MEGGLPLDPTSPNSGRGDGGVTLDRIEPAVRSALGAVALLLSAITAICFLEVILRYLFRSLSANRAI